MNTIISIFAFFQKNSKLYNLEILNTFQTTRNSDKAVHIMLRYIALSSDTTVKV